MPRCACPAPRRRALLSFGRASLTALLCTGPGPGRLATLAGAGLAAGTATAQVRRHFPQNALRGELSFLSATELLLNGNPARLAPGARLRGQDNMLVVSGLAIGQRLIANYTLDSLGNVKDVWILRQEEIAMWPWPRTVQESLSWGFNFDTQTWVKP